MTQATYIQYMCPIDSSTKTVESDKVAKRKPAETE